jgi:peptide/nickel transport system substrate-binding protein
MGLANATEHSSHEVKFLTLQANSMKLPDMHRSLRVLIISCFIFALSAPRASSVQKNEQTEFLQLQNLSGTRGGNLVLAVDGDPENFNQMLTSGLANMAITQRISAGLVRVNRSNLQLEPSLAKRWDVDESGRTYTIHLRRGVRFSNGDNFSADDVLFTFQVLSDPNIPSQMVGQIEIEGKSPTVTKIDDFTVKLSFQRPVGMGLRMLDSIPIIPKSRLLKPYREGRFVTTWGPAVNPEEVVGLGPFRLKEYQRGIKVVLERNPYFWKRDRNGQTLPYLDTVTFLIVPDLNSQALRFQRGELDLVSSPTLNPESYASLRRRQIGYTLRDLGPGLTMDFLWFNLNRGSNDQGRPYVEPDKLSLFEKPEFRLAVSHALDREGMARSILLGLGVPQYGPVSSGNRDWTNKAVPRTDYDPDRSRELLQRIGLRDTNGDGILEYGSSGRPLELMLFTTRGNSVREKTAQVIQNNLSKVGIRIRIQHFLLNEIASRFLNSFDWETILFGVVPTDVTPDLQSELWYSSGSMHLWNPGQTKPESQWEADIDSLISKLVRSMDPAARKASFGRAQEIWAEQMPAIPTFASNILVGWSNRLGNVRPSILAPHLIWNAEELTLRKP